MNFHDASRICTIITTTIISLGLIGNALSFAVFSRQAFRKSSINIYCRALAIFDSFIASNLIFQIGTVYLDDSWLSNQDIACKLNYYITLSMSPVSGWILVFFSIDQLINVTTVTRCQFANKRVFQFATIGVIFFAHVLMYISVPIQLTVANVSLPDLNQTTLVCTIASLPNPLVGELFYMIEANILPFCFMMLITVLILRRLQASTLNLQKTLSNINNQPNTTSQVQFFERKKSKQRKFAVHCVFMNLLFVLLTLPVMLSFLFPTMRVQLDENSDMINDNDIILGRIMSIFFFINYSTHFLMHFVVNSLFRREFLLMTRLGRFLITTSSTTQQGT